MELLKSMKIYPTTIFQGIIKYLFIVFQLYYEKKKNEKNTVLK